MADDAELESERNRRLAMEQAMRHYYEPTIAAFREALVAVYQRTTDPDIRQIVANVLPELLAPPDDPSANVGPDDEWRP